MATTNMQFGQSAINVVLNEGQLPAKLATDSSGNVTGLVGPDGTNYSTLGSSIITAGTGGRYSTLQAAIDAALSETQFTETALTGTATFTKGSKVVTGSGTAFTTELLYATHISVTTGGIRKWYPLQGTVISDTVVVLDVPFMDATAADAGIVGGTPVQNNIMLLSDATGTNVTIGDGSANLVGSVNINANGFHVDRLSNNLTSGAVSFSNCPHFEQYSGLTAYVGDVTLENLRRQRAGSTSQQDWIAAGGAVNYTGRLFANNLRASGNFDLFLPSVVGRFSLTNSVLRSVPDTAATVETTNQPVNGLFAYDGAEGYIAQTKLVAGCYGAAQSNCINAEGYYNENSRLTANNILHLKDVTAELEKASGSTENTTSRGVFIGVDNSDIYLDDVTFVYRGSPTPGASWRQFASDPGVVTPNRVHVRSSTLFDLRSITTNAVITTLRGDRGVKALTVAATLDANELSALRGQVFTVALGATLITSIPAVTNAPEGTEIHFIFTQDGVGGRNVTGWNAAYLFHTAWSNTGNTSNKISTVSFRKSGSRWIQTGAANAWL